MKKLMFALATAAALVGMADIESANTVGYVEKANVKAGIWSILPCQFETTQSTEVDVNSYVVGTFEKNHSFYDSDWMTAAPQLQFRDPKTGDPQFAWYISDAYNEGGEVEELPGWADSNGNYIKSLTIQPGTAFWFWNNTDCSVTFAGQVIASDTCALTVYPVWTLIGNAYPIAFGLNSLDWGEIDATHSFYDDDWMTAAPQIQTRDANGNPGFFYYLKDAYVEADDSELSGWADSNGNYVNVQVLPGEGIWLKPTSETVVEYTK